MAENDSSINQNKTESAENAAWSLDSIQPRDVGIASAFSYAWKAYKKRFLILTALGIPSLLLGTGIHSALLEKWISEGLSYYCHIDIPRLLPNNACFDFAFIVICALASIYFFLGLLQYNLRLIAHSERKLGNFFPSFGAFIKFTLAIALAAGVVYSVGEALFMINAALGEGTLSEQIEAAKEIQDGTFIQIGKDRLPINSPWISFASFSFIIVFFWLSLRWFLTPFFILDRRCSILSACRASAKTMRRNYWNLTGALFFSGLILSVSPILFLIGLFFAYAYINTVYTVFYLSASRQIDLKS